MCMADKDSKRRIPFAYLNDIKSRFEEMYGDTIMTAVENNMNEEFSRVMEKRMVDSYCFGNYSCRISLILILRPIQLHMSADRLRK